MKKILLVDDCEISLDIAKNALEDKYEVTSAKSGYEAIGFLSKGLIPDLILLDILMPEMDGWEAFKIIKGICLLRDIPIAFLTSLDSEKDKNSATSLGAADFINKSFEKEEFVKRIDLILEKELQSI